MARQIKTGIVFLKESMIEEQIKKLETREGMFLVETPRIANEDEMKENGVPKTEKEEWNAYVYKWRFATKKEWNATVRKYGGVFQSI